MDYMEIARKKTMEIEARVTSNKPEPVTPPPAEGRPIRLAAMEQRREALSDPPIKPGWVVAFRARSGLTEGGTVASATPSGSGWRFRLSCGVELSEHQILSVARVEGGRWLGAWTVAARGLSGEGAF